MLGVRNVLCTATNTWVCVLCTNCFVLSRGWVISLFEKFSFDKIQTYFNRKVDYFHTTNDRESSQESHCSSNSRKHVHKLGRAVPGNPIKDRGVKNDFDKF